MVLIYIWFIIGFVVFKVFNFGFGFVLFLFVLFDLYVGNCFVLFTIGFSTAKAKPYNFGVFKRWFFLIIGYFWAIVVIIFGKDKENKLTYLNY